MVAIVAVVAILLQIILAEVVEKVFAAAVGGFGVGCCLRKELFHDFLLRNRLLGREFLQFIEIFGVIEGNAETFAVVTDGAGEVNGLAVTKGDRLLIADDRDIVVQGAVTLVVCA
jgi:hypothetical protein